MKARTTPTNHQQPPGDSLYQRQDVPPGCLAPVGCYVLAMLYDSSPADRCPWPVGTPATPKLRRTPFHLNAHCRGAQSCRLGWQRVATFNGWPAATMAWIHHGSRRWWGGYRGRAAPGVDSESGATRAKPQTGGELDGSGARGTTFGSGEPSNNRLRLGLIGLMMSK